MQQNLYHNPNFQEVVNSSHMPDASQWPKERNFTPVSEALYMTTATATWAHTVPSFMPWVPDSNSATSSDPIVRFTAPFPPDPCTSKTATSWELLNNLSMSKSNANLHLKRRNDVGEPIMFPRKQLVTEEKMAARLQNLHISNQFNVPHEDPHVGLFAGNAEDTKKSIKTLKQLEVMLSSNNSDENSPYKGSLILAPEIKNLIEPEKLFTKTFLSEVERPKMAVVLWKPPHGSVEKIISPQLSSKESRGDSQNSFPTLSSLVEKCHSSLCEQLKSVSPLADPDAMEDCEMET